MFIAQRTVQDMHEYPHVSALGPNEGSYKVEGIDVMTEFQVEKSSEGRCCCSLIAFSYLFYHEQSCLDGLYIL